VTSGSILHSVRDFCGIRLQKLEGFSFQGIAGQAIETGKRMELLLLIWLLPLLPKAGRRGRRIFIFEDIVDGRWVCMW